MSKMFDDNTTSLDFAEFMAGILVTVGLHQWQAATAGVTRDEPFITGTQVYPATGERPDIFIAHSLTRAAVFVGGCVNLSLAQKFYAGFLDPIGPGIWRSQPINTFTVAIADFIQSEITALGVNPGAPKVFAGHSFGGTVAQILATRYNNLGGTSTGAYASFGSPKWCTTEEATQAGRTPGARWMNNDDPLPIFPFTVADSLAAILVVPPTAMVALSQMVQPRGGVQVFTNGNTEPQTLPTNASVGNLLDFASWMFGQETSTTNPHSMAEYNRRMQTAAASARQPIAATRISVDMETPATSTRRVFNQAEARVTTAVSNVQAIQNRPPLDVPAPRLFKATRQGGVYLISFGDTSIGLTSSKKTARSLCRQWNTALRHLQRVGFVDTQNLTTQFNSFIAAASDPAGGFSPVMNTTLPTA